MVNVAQEIAAADSPDDPENQNPSGCSESLFGSEMKCIDTFVDKDDISPHYDDEIVDLEDSIERLRNLLKLKQGTTDSSCQAEQDNINYMR